MKVLYSTQSVVEYDGQHYYNNTINSTYQRYLALGEELTVLTHMKKVEAPQSNMIADGALRFVFIPKINTLKSFLLYSRKIHRIVKDEVRNTDVCVVHMNGHAGDVVKYAKKYNKPIMTVIGGCTWDALWNYDLRGKLLAPWSFWEVRRIQRKVDYTIYVTKFFLQNRYPNRGRSVACSNVNVKTGLPGVIENRLKRIDDIKTSGKLLRIGTLAALDVPYKGQEYVIRALYVLKQKGRKFEYHLIGRGDKSLLRKQIEAYDLSDQVIIHGPVPHEKILELLDTIDIYIQPSMTEGLPRALIEAMSRGCLCMGTKTGGIPELIDNCYLFEKGNVKQIVSLLENVTQEDFINQANRNYEEAKDYDKDVLDERRKKFILEFKNSFSK